MAGGARKIGELVSQEQVNVSVDACAGRARGSRWPLLVATAILLCGLAPGAARAEDLYYMMVFGSQQLPARAKYCHSFAVFVRAIEDVPGSRRYRLESHTISWMPVSYEIRLAALLPECGFNADLPTTFAWTRATCQRVSMWGPYQIQSDLYCRALEEEALLNSGDVWYKAIDTGYPTDFACNCIHAVSSIAGGYRMRVLSPSFGETASWYLTRRLSPWIIDCFQRHDWIAAALGIDRYGVVRREFENPRSGPLYTVLRPADTGR
jgi:hypothetical protein